MKYLVFDAVRGTIDYAKTDNNGNCSYKNLNMDFYNFLVYAAYNKLRIKYGQELS